MSWDELRQLVRTMVDVGCMCSAQDKCTIHEKATRALLIIDGLELRRG